MAEAATNLDRGRRQVIRGVVVSAKMNKTRVIEVKRTKRHGLYHKNLVKRVRFFIHDEKNESQVGDTVEVASTRPISKNKSFALTKILEKQVVK